MMKVFLGEMKIGNQRGNLHILFLYLLKRKEEMMQLEKL